MENRRIEVFLDNHVRKVIADELRQLYGSAQGDIPECLQNVLKTLDERVRPPRDADAKIRTRH
jgi:hypothetical protein